MRTTTFYSYKGGVGRTLSLINIGYALAERARQVLLVDFDLEAPGLSYVCCPADGGSPLSERPGIVELLSSGQKALSRLSEADDPGEPNADQLFGDLRDYCYQVSCPPCEEGPASVGLFAIPAGVLDATYGSRLAALNLPEFYSNADASIEEQIGAGDFFSLLRDKWNSEFDYILVDSRTGQSEESGICTQVLADNLVVLSGLNAQNQQGTIRQLRLWAEATEAEPFKKMILLHSPVPLGYDAEVDAGTGQLIDQLSRTSNLSVLRDVRIPYHPRLAIDEWTFTRLNPRSEISLRYREVAQLLRERVEGSSLALVDDVRALLEAGQVNRAIDLVRESGSEDRLEYELVLERVAWLITESNFRQSVTEFFEEITAEDPHSEVSLTIRRRIAETYARAGEWGLCQDAYSELREGQEVGSASWLSETTNLIRAFLHSGACEEAFRIAASSLVELELFEVARDPDTANGLGPSMVDEASATGRIEHVSARLPVSAPDEFESGNGGRTSVLANRDAALTYQLWRFLNVCLRAFCTRGGWRHFDSVIDLIAGEYGDDDADVDSTTDEALARRVLESVSPFVDRGAAALERLSLETIRIVADAYSSRGFPLAAEVLLAQAIVRSREAEDSSGSSRTYVRLGYLHLNGGEARRSETDSLAALRLDVRGDTHARARALCLSALVDISRLRFDEAEVRLDDSSSLFREMHREADRLSVERVQLELARLTGRPDRSLTLRRGTFLAAVTEDDRRGSLHRALEGYATVAWFHLDLGEWGEAERRFDGARRVAVTLGHPNARILAAYREGAALLRFVVAGGDRPGLAAIDATLATPSSLREELLSLGFFGWLAANVHEASQQQRRHAFGEILRLRDRLGGLSDRADLFLAASRGAAAVIGETYMWEAAAGLACGLSVLAPRATRLRESVLAEWERRSVSGVAVTPWLSSAPTFLRH